MLRNHVLKVVPALVGAVLVWAQAAPAAPVISEFMASNRTALADDDGSYPDWLEIHNPDTTPVDLNGWYLTDSARTLTKWRIPAVTIAPGGYLLVFASSKNRTDPTRQLHTNFELSAGGEYLGLIRPDGVTAASEYAPTFPPQVANISYGITQPAVVTEVPQFGFFGSPTPGSRNGGAASLALPASVGFSRAAGTFVGTVTISLTGAAANQRIRYELNLPSAAGPVGVEPTAASPLYTGPIAVGASTIIRARIFSADDTQFGPTAIAGYVRLETAGLGSLAEFSTALPVVVLDPHGAGEWPNDGIDHPAWIHIFQPSIGTGTPPVSTKILSGAPTWSLPATAVIRGRSSANFPKKSFNFDLSDASGRDNPQPLLGLAAAKDWSLVSLWSYDRAHVRNAFVYALGTRLGHWAPKTKFVELFLNTGGEALEQADYYGISVLTERIKVAPTRVNITPLSVDDVKSSEITGGYVLSLDNPSAKNFTWRTTRGFPSGPDIMLNVDSPKADKLAPAQVAYIKDYVQQMEDALFADRAGGWVTRRYLEFIDRPSWVDFHLLNLFVANVDGFQSSVFFTKDRGGKLVAGPLWDFDRSMDSADGRDAVWAQWQPATVPDFWSHEWWGELARDPDFFQAWVDRWQTLRRGPLADTALTGLADSLAAQVTPAAAARDAARWPDNEGRFPGGFFGEIAHLKEWITLRARWLDQRFTALPSVEFNGQKYIVTAPDGAQLAYTLDGADPRASGGRVASGAALSSGSVALDAGQLPKLRVRTYDGRVADFFPGSPWSSLARFDELPKAARLVNLSSRGFIGSGESVLLSGVVVRGPSPKQFLIRAIGPGLADFGVTGALPDPVLSVVASDGALLASNTRWETASGAGQMAVAGAAVGAFPMAAGSADSALIMTLPPGGYTFLVSSASAVTGVGLIEVYELDSTASRAVSLSARAFVEPGNRLLIGGITISGFAPKRVLVRAVGPALGAFGVAGALPDPNLTVFGGNGAVLGSNDDWGVGPGAAEIVAAASSAGAFAPQSGSKDAALVLTLNPGNYTLQIAGKDSGGVALVEVYELTEL